LHNARTLAADLHRAGSGVWDRFNRGPDQTLWYYTKVAELARERLGDHPLVTQVEDAVNRLTILVENDAGSLSQA
jgi:hypothetical protein